jgi:hypothetical protein
MFILLKIDLVGYIPRSRDTLVGVATRLCTGRPRIRFSMGSRYLCLIQTGSCAHPAYLTGLPGGLVTHLHQSHIFSWSGATLPYLYTKRLGSMVVASALYLRVS